MKLKDAVLASLLVVFLGFTGISNTAELNSGADDTVKVKTWSSETATCAAASHSGGDWPALNHNNMNDRFQSDQLPPGRNSTLKPVWSFDLGKLGIENGVRSTPVIANGCVYIAMGKGYLGDRGDIVALNADSGELVWHAELDASVLGLAVANGLVYATPSKGTRGDIEFPVVTEDYAPAGSFAIALNADDGTLHWIGERLDDGTAENGTFINASPVVFRAGGRKLLFLPLAGGSGDGARVPMYFIDALTGKTLSKAYSLTDKEYEEGYGGTGIWSTAAYDEETGFLYAGTSDSDGHTRQHPYNNAILKIDANPQRDTFATVVAAYTGTTEHANLDSLIGYPNNPVCEATADDGVTNPPTFFDTSASTTCLEMDFDFGASANLFKTLDGKTKIAALQKSGVFHLVDAQSMTADWTLLLSAGGAANNAATASVAGENLYVDASPNLLYQLDKTTGATGWIATTGLDALAYEPVTTAGGILYTITNSGELLGFETSTGAPIFNRQLALDGNFEQCLGVGSGVAIARNTIFAPCNASGTTDLAGLPQTPGGLIAYRWVD